MNPSYRNAFIVLLKKCKCPCQLDKYYVPTQTYYVSSFRENSEVNDKANAVGTCLKSPNLPSSKPTLTATPSGSIIRRQREEIEMVSSQRKKNFQRGGQLFRDSSHSHCSHCEICCEKEVPKRHSSGGTSSRNSREMTTPGGGGAEGEATTSTTRVYVCFSS